MKKIASALSLLLLAGCSSTAPLEIQTKPVENVIIQPAAPRSPKLNDINWQVVTKQNLDQFIQSQAQKQSSSNPVFITMSMQDYQTLSLNMAELKRYIQQQKSIIVYYENATKRPAAKPGN